MFDRLGRSLPHLIEAVTDLNARRVVRPESTLTSRYVRDGGLFDVVIIKRFAKHPRFCDFVIALLQILVPSSSISKFESYQAAWLSV